MSVRQRVTVHSLRCLEISLWRLFQEWKRSSGPGSSFTEVVGLDPNRLYPSVYEDDDEAFGNLNKKMGIPAERIFRFGKEDNFWEHGSGPWVHVLRSTMTVEKIRMWKTGMYSRM